MTNRSLSFHLLVLIPLLAGCRTATADTPPTAACLGPIDVQSAEDVRVLAACTSIDGDLRILSSSLRDLRGLEHITSVGNLVVADNAALTDLAGLSGLTHVEGLAIYGNPKLASLRGLEGLRGPVTGIWIENNASLADVGLENVEAAEVTILSNAVLPLASVIP